MEEKKDYEVIFGRLGRNPELRRTQDGGYVCDFSVAIDNGKDKPPTWKRIVLWGEQAQRCAKHLKKGNEVFVRGRNAVKTFTTKEGQEKSYEEVAAHLVGLKSV